MNPERDLGALLRWQEAHHARSAPPPPRAAQLLEQARPWWERWPEKFSRLADPLRLLDVRYGHAATGANAGRGGFPVPTVVVRTQAEDRTLAAVLYLAIEDERLRLRFQLNPAPVPLAASAEVTFVDAKTARALFAASARLVAGGEYRLDAELPPELAAAWVGLKVTDRMPFHLILESDGA